ncbi:pilus assembly protein TadG-related protein [Arthrobacter sp. SLBN-122]|uniref:pilus assembly protein TadG-related protein n=1 Tax=Arthrobacter sp. SLBN-122 TaxID=2768455 RepID=UPI001152953E|nr:TadE/TadG family type IV pilus assembly protein [Arthrobacter sp. SLBN-122]TQJ33294.1 putative Flp pilus-assembly TadE/G-like protein [Arthrobacter sp. SLBN-122]
MRRLTTLGRPQGKTSERGAISVIVAIMLVVLLGSAAIAVDVGVIYSERAQLQSGADSSAIALAQKCARSITDSLCSTTSTLAANLANQNALDGKSNVYNIQLEKTARTVSVITTAKGTGAPDNSVSLFFANALGVPSKEVGAKSSAVWGSPIKGPTAFPLAFSICQVQNMVDHGLQVLQNKDSKSANPGCTLPSGGTVPGGFGWLAQDTGKCGASIDLSIDKGGSDPTSTKTGNSAPSNCEGTLNGWAADITAGRKVIVLLPVFDKVTGTGAGAIYHLTAFAAFNVVGWKFSGQDNTTPYSFSNTAPKGSGSAATATCTGDCRGIIGEFVTYVSLVDGYTLGPVSPYGATIVRLSL